MDDDNTLSDEQLAELERIARRREATVGLRTYGHNELARPHQRSPLLLFAANFTHVLALLPWVAAFLAFVGRLHRPQPPGTPAR
jgi:Cation transporter/ATPase, N-terminus